MSQRPIRLSGFTLVELVVSIVITAIVASFIVLFLEAPVQDYFTQTQRSDLVDSANRIADAFTNDLRTALPNSMRFSSVGSRTALEFIATQGVARYYGKGDKNGAAGEELIAGSQVTSFGTLDLFGSLPAAPMPYLSVGNLGNPAAPAYDAYIRGNGVMTPRRIRTVGPNPNASPPPAFVTGENLASLSARMTFQVPGPPGTQPSVHNAYLVSGPVSYVCDKTAGTLTRYSGYAVTSAQRVPPRGTSALIAHDVANCTVSTVSPASPSYGELAVLTVTLSNGGETLQVFLEASTEYSQ